MAHTAHLAYAPAPFGTEVDMTVVRRRCTVDVDVSALLMLMCLHC
jgi:hypothetical protein